jgi:hypothetical protein
MSTSRNVNAYGKAARVVDALRAQLRIAEGAKALAYGKLKGAQLREAQAVATLGTEYLVKVRITVKRSHPNIPEGHPHGA